MSRQLTHMTNIHQAAQELHKRFQGVAWYIDCRVLSLPPERTAATDKQERREIVVYVRNKEAAEGNAMTTFNSWPVRYEVGSG